jgi:hypothetical protein
VLACRVGAVSGWRCLGWTADEISKWNNEGSDPTAEMIASMDAMTVTHPVARRRLFSSPMGTMGLHYDTWSAGDTADTLTCHAASWEANPSITREHTIKLARGDMRVHRREYEAIAQDDVVSVFASADIDRAMLPRPPTLSLKAEHPYVLCLDASRGGDAFTFCTARWVVEEVAIDASNCGTAPNGLPWCLAVPPRFEQREWLALEGRFARQTQRQDVRGNWHDYEPPPSALPRAVLHVDEVGEVPKSEMADTERAVRFLGRIAKSKKIRHVFQDQFEAGALGAMLRRVGLRPFEQTWTASTKSAAVDRLDRMLRDSHRRLPPEPTLRKQLCEYSERITRAGAISYGGRGRHDDWAAVIVTLIMSSISRELPGDPFGIDRHRHELGP